MAYYRAVQPRYIKRAIQPQRVAQPQRVLTPRRAVYVPQYRSLPYRPIRRQADENVAAFAPVDAFLKGIYIKSILSPSHFFKNRFVV